MDRSHDMAVPLTAMTSDPNGKGPGFLWEQAHPSEIDSLRPSTPDPGAREEKKVKEEEAAGEEEERQTERILWSSKREYLLSTIGYSVGVGNLFRFPYLCNRNGGGAFLIPFLLSLMLIGLPLFTMEVVMGQFSGRNAQQVWAICPLFKGVGWAMVICSTICFYYYNTVMAWGFYYMASSFQSVVPWASCDGWWNTPQCFTYSNHNTSSALVVNSSLFSNASLGMNYTMPSNATIGGNLSVTGSDVTATKRVSSSEEFWQHNVLQLSDGFGEPGSVVWYLALTLTLALLLCFLSLIKGIHSSGKVAYVTATAPYLLVTALLVRGATLPGAVDGVLFYIRPDFTKLLQPQVWIEAALQVFFSLGPGWGGLIVMSSYNKFHNNCLRDSLIITLVSEATSIYGGFAIFSVIGYMAHVSEQDIDKVVSSGPGLAFIAYPEAISLMPLPQLWAVLFFLMIITLVIDSQITNGEVALTTIIDLYPRVLRHRRAVITAVFCVVFLLLSLSFVTQGGMYLFQLIDWFMGAVTVILIGFIECLVVGWIYGVSRFGDDIYLMLGTRPPFILRLFWQYITPVLLVVLLVATFVNYTPPTYGDYVYGPGGTGFGWCVAFSSFIPIPAVAVYHLWKAQGTIAQGGMYVFQLVDWFVAALSLIVIGFIECLVVGWFYGVRRFGDDIYLMLGRRPPFILCLFWQYITPVLLLVLLVATFVNYTPPTYGDYVYGPGGTGFGWCVAFSSFIPIPAVAVYHLWNAQGTLAQRLRKTLKPDYTIWKPANVTAALTYGKEISMLEKDDQC